MIISFFESFKYLGHIWPVALLRIFTGLFFFNAGLAKLKSGFLQQPHILDTLQKWIDSGAMDPGYILFVQRYVMGHWQIFSSLVVFGELAVGAAFVLGFMVRPAALGAILMNVNFLMAAGQQAAPVNKAFLMINITLFLVSAGRCAGFDYYFYKRIRGIWW